MWDGRYYDASNTYTYLYHTAQGCDSLVTMHLTIYPTYNHTIEATICEGKDFHSAFGCDSTYVLYLTVYPKYETPKTVQIEEDETYNFYGTILSTPGIYTHKLYSVHGCDSVIKLTLMVVTTKAVIIATSGPGGRITPAGVIKIPFGNSQAFYFTPDPGYKIESVIVDGVNITAAVLAGTYTFVNLQSNHTIHVTFVTDEITITATAGPNGTITPAGVIKIAEGKSQAFTFKPATNYKIEKVLVDGVNNATAVSTGMYTFSKITESHTIHVTFVSKVAAALAVDDSNWSKEVEVYTYLNTVYITIPNTSHPIVVDIFDMMGRHLHQRTLTDATTAIPLNVATGIYMIRLISQNEIIMVNKVSLTKF